MLLNSVCKLPHLEFWFLASRFPWFPFRAHKFTAIPMVNVHVLWACSRWRCGGDIIVATICWFRKKVYGDKLTKRNAIIEGSCSEAFGFNISKCECANLSTTRRPREGFNADLIKGNYQNWALDNSLQIIDTSRRNRFLSPWFLVSRLSVIRSYFIYEPPPLLLVSPIQFAYSFN